jgi:hypothetical protein
MDGTKITISYCTIRSSISLVGEMRCPEIGAVVREYTQVDLDLNTLGGAKVYQEPIPSTLILKAKLYSRYETMVQRLRSWPRMLSGNQPSTTTTILSVTEVYQQPRNSLPNRRWQFNDADDCRYLQSWYIADCYV